MPSSAAAASSSRRRQEGLERTGSGRANEGGSTGFPVPATRPRPYKSSPVSRHSSPRKASQHSSTSVGSGSLAVTRASGTVTTAGTTAAASSSSGRGSQPSHHPYATAGGSPSKPPSVVSNVSAASGTSSVSERIRRIEGSRIRKLIKKRGFSFGNKNKKGVAGEGALIDREVSVPRTPHSDGIRTLESEGEGPDAVLEDMYTSARTLESEGGGGSPGPAGPSSGGGGGAWGGPAPSLGRAASQSSQASGRSVPPGEVTSRAEEIRRAEELGRYSSLPDGPGGRGPGDESAGAAAAAVEYGGHGSASGGGGGGDSPSGRVGVASSYLSRRLGGDGPAEPADGRSSRGSVKSGANTPSDYTGTVEEQRTRDSRDLSTSKDLDERERRERGERRPSKADQSYAEWASVGGGMPRKRSLDSWRGDGGMDDGSGGRNKSASSARESPSKTAGRRRSSASQRSPGVLRHSKSTNNISDLEVLGLTVQSINAALSSGAVREGTGSPVRSPMGPDGAARSGEAQPYILSGAKFHPRGCVWDVSIQVS